MIIYYFFENWEICKIIYQTFFVFLTIFRNMIAKSLNCMELLIINDTTIFFLLF